jgi:hypothetical protein
VTGLPPWPVYLAGAKTVETLALERHRQYQADWGVQRIAEQLVSEG